MSHPKPCPSDTDLPPFGDLGTDDAAWLPMFDDLDLPTAADDAAWLPMFDDD